MAWLLWVGFVALILAALAIDLFVANRKAHAISIREALRWTAVWVGLALVFNVVVYFIYENQWFGIGQHPDGGLPTTGAKAALDFFTGYLIEESLSLDNLFVIAMIFSYFRVEPRYQHRVLFWGILGAMIMRGVMIWGGVALIHRFDWMMYVFGSLLLYSAWKMFRAGETHVEPDHNPLVRLARRVYPVTPHFEDEKFFTRMDGRRAITPLFLVLLVVESTDLLFAIDSIPAIIGVTQDPFLVFTSNIFAILGLRSLYFALAGMMDKFRYLKFSLVFLLAFIGVKLILAAPHIHFEIPTPLSLGIVASALAVGVIASLVASRREAGAGRPTAAAPLPEEPR